MATNISSNKALDTYALFNATDIKSYIIKQLSESDNPAFTGASYLGSNMNAIIDILSLMMQQILFHLSVNTSEANFATANLYESMSKLVNILNYKTIGKQTSMLPVRFTVDIEKFKEAVGQDANQITIPRFANVAYNGTYYLKNEIVIPITDITASDGYITVDSVMFQGELHESQLYVARGDQFESFVLEDNNIKHNNRFISDNFFLVFVDEKGDGSQWKEYTETTSLFLHGVDELKFERRFNEDLNYEFRFGNGVNGKKLDKGARVVIFYIISSGEEGILGDNTINNTMPFEYESALWSSILKSNYTTAEVTNPAIKHNCVYATNTGNGTEISYPESVASIRANAPRLFASQNRLFTLKDYELFINKNFGSYIKDVYLCKNDEYTKDYLKYYYDIGLDCPQEDSRLNIAQVEFMTSTNFNNIYCFTVPRVNTLIGGRVPNYLNNTLKQQVVNATADYKGATHNLVMIDPIYKAMTWGAYLDDTDFNAAQLSNKLVLVRNRLTKYSYTYIKDYAIDVIKNYFNSLTIGSEVNLAQLTKDLQGVPGVKNFYIRTLDGNTEKKMTLYTWNPLYSNEDNTTTQQTIINEPFVYPYFYDLDNVGNTIIIEDE